MPDKTNIKEEVAGLSELYTRRDELAAALQRVNDERIDLETKLAEVEGKIDSSVGKIRDKLK